LACLGHKSADLDLIVITHAHADHYGLAEELSAASGAEVVTHPWSVAALRADQREQRRQFYASLVQQAGAPDAITEAIDEATQAVRRFGRPVSIDRLVNEGDSVRLAGYPWQVLHTPGHTGGLICLFEPITRTLLSSDHLLANVSSNPVVEPPPPGQSEYLRSLVLYRASLQRIAAMQIDRALPSHGPPIYDVAGLVFKRLVFHESRLKRVLDALHAGAQTTWEVTCALFPEHTALDTFLALSEVLGHLDLLAMEGQILAERRGGVVFWRPTGNGGTSSLPARPDTQDVEQAP
jgi:glyoxylase-like metal-dependent hydrolase (beta-lactamase superfamily II)